MRRRTFIASSAAVAARPMALLARAVPSVRTVEELQAAFDAGHRAIRVFAPILVRSSQVIRITGCVLLGS